MTGAGAAQPIISRVDEIQHSGSGGALYPLSRSNGARIMDIKIDWFATETIKDAEYRVAILESAVGDALFEYGKGSAELLVAEMKMFDAKKDLSRLMRQHAINMAKVSLAKTGE